MKEYTEFALELRRLIENMLSPHENCIERVADILGLTTRTIYNKFNGSGEFTISELGKLVKVFGINPISLIYTGWNGPGLPLSIRYVDFSKEDEYIQNLLPVIQAYEKGATDENSVYMVTSNQIPQVGHVSHLPMARFILLKWLYYNKDYSDRVPFSDIIPNQRELDILARYRQSIINLEKSIYIVTMDMYKNFLDEVLFFYKIEMLTVEEVRELIDAVEDCFERFEMCCRNGYSYHQGKEIEIYCSPMNIYNEMALMESDKVNMGFFFAHFNYFVMADLPETFTMAKNWFLSWKKTSNIISLSSPLERYKFMSKQKNDIQRMKSLFNPTR